MSENFPLMLPPKRTNLKWKIFVMFDGAIGFEGGTHSPFFVKSNLTSPRVKAVISSILLKQSNSSFALHWNFSSKTIVLQSILTPSDLSGAAPDGFEWLMTALLLAIRLTTGVAAVDA